MGHAGCIRGHAKAEALEANGLNAPAIGLGLDDVNHGLSAPAPLGAEAGVAAAAPPACGDAGVAVPVAACAGASDGACVGACVPCGAPCIPAPCCAGAAWRR